MFAPAALNVEPLVADDERLSDDAPVELLIDLFNSDWWQHVVYNHVRFFHFVLSFFLSLTCSLC